MFDFQNSPIHLSGMNLVVCESASGAPAAVILPFDADTERLISGETEAELWCN